MHTSDADPPSPDTPAETLPADTDGAAAFTRLDVASNVTAGVAWLAWLVPAGVEVGRWAAPAPD